MTPAPDETAADVPENTETVAAETPAEAAEETVQVIQDQTEEGTASAPVTEEPAEKEAEQAEAETEPAEEENSTEEENEEPEEEETGEEELYATAVDGAQIIVRKLNGAFPPGAYVKVLLISDDSTQSAVENALDAKTELVDMIAYDITIWDKDGNEIIPDNDIQVTILGASLESGQEASVYHIEESGAAEKVKDVQDPAEISFDALPG